MLSLNGKWSYESYCPKAGTDELPSQIAAPWAPRGSLQVTTDASGKVTGTLKFAPRVELSVTGCMTNGGGKTPDGIDLTGEGMSAVYRIRGYFVAGAVGPIVVGTIVSVMNDLAKQPIGTSGPFVLFPAAE